MEAKEFGKGHNRKVLLIPGNMMSWRQFENVIPILEKNFHVIAVSTDGYDGMTEFTTTEKAAENIEAYIADNLGSHVNLVFGESFGSATTGLLFHRQRVKIDSIIMNGPQYMNLGFLTGLLKRMIPKNQYRLIRKVKSGRESGKMPLMLKLYTHADDANMLKMFEAMPDNITLKTLQNCMNEALYLYETIDLFEPDSDAKVSIWHGAKEPNMKIALEKLKRAFPNLEDHPFTGMGHGDIIGHPELMAEEIKKFVDR
ncbi:MAG: alpha/beta hydrolase [Bacteroidales bacterium]|nr:alpha/beta hydrolase [Clostridium sp.]MCM1204683.1 alpha/beta hydrolase [Bacteroidales bacterium]